MPSEESKEDYEEESKEERFNKLVKMGNQNQLEMSSSTFSPREAPDVNRLERLCEVSGQTTLKVPMRERSNSNLLR